MDRSEPMIERGRIQSGSRAVVLGVAISLALFSTPDGMARGGAPLVRTAPVVASIAAQAEPPVAQLHLPWLAKGVARGPRLEGITQWGGAARAVALDGDHVWLGVGAQVWAVEVAAMEAAGLAGAEPASAVAWQSAALPGIVYGFALDVPRRRLHVALRTASAASDKEAGSPSQKPTEPTGLLLSLNVVDPEQPFVMQRLPVPDAASVALAGDRLVVAAEREGRERPVEEAPAWTGLYVFAIDDAGLPVPGGHLALSDARSLVVADGFAYTCDPAAGVLAVVDVHDAEQPRDAGLVPDVPCATLAADDGLLAAVVSPIGGVPNLRLLDRAEDPARPRPLATLPLFGEAWEDEPSPEALHRGWALAVDAGMAWVTGQDPRPWRRWVDLSDPSNPRPAHVAREPVVGLAIDARDGRVAIAGVQDDPEGAASRPLAQRSSSHLDLLRAAGALTLYRQTPVEDEDSPEPGWIWSGWLDTPSRWIVEAAVDESTATAYLVEARSAEGGARLGLWVADLAADPPRLVRRIDLPADLRALPELGRWQIDMVVHGEHVAITVAGTTWVLGGREGGGVKRAATGAVALASTGGALFAAGGGSLVPWYIDVTGGLEPMGPPIAVLDHPWLRLAASQDHLWLSTAPDLLAYFDIREPGTPDAVGEIALPGEGAVLAADGARAVALDGAGRLTLLEAPGVEGSADRAPTVLASHRVPEALRPTADVAFDGRRAWWPVLDGGVGGLDLGRPRGPAALVGSSASQAAMVLAAAGALEDEEINPFHAARVATSADRVLVTRYGEGVRVLRVVEAEGP